MWIRYSGCPAHRLHSETHEYLQKHIVQRIKKVAEPPS